MKKFADPPLENFDIFRDLKFVLSWLILAILRGPQKMREYAFYTESRVVQKPPKQIVRISCWKSKICQNFF